MDNISTLCWSLSTRDCCHVNILTHAEHGHMMTHVQGTLVNIVTLVNSDTDIWTHFIPDTSQFLTIYPLITLFKSPPFTDTAIRSLKFSCFVFTTTCCNLIRIKNFLITFIKVTDISSVCILQTEMTSVVNKILWNQEIVKLTFHILS